MIIRNYYYQFCSLFFFLPVLDLDFLLVPFLPPVTGFCFLGLLFFVLDLDFDALPSLSNPPKIFKGADIIIIRIDVYYYNGYYL